MHVREAKCLGLNTKQETNKPAYKIKNKTNFTQRFFVHLFLSFTCFKSTQCSETGNENLLTFNLAEELKFGMELIITLKSIEGKNHLGHGTTELVDLLSLSCCMTQAGHLHFSGH